MKMLILVRVISSYFPHNPNGTVFRFVYDVTEPILGPLRRLIPVPRTMPLDFSPIVAYLLLELVEQFVLRTLY